jgi:hypothetical protein
MVVSMEWQTRWLHGAFVPELERLIDPYTSGDHEGIHVKGDFFPGAHKGMHTYCSPFIPYSESLQA